MEMTIDRDGCTVRAATDAEVEFFWAGQTHPKAKRGEFTWAHSVRLPTGEVVDYHNGPGVWFGGAGF